MANHQLDNEILRGFELRITLPSSPSPSPPPLSTTATTTTISSYPSPAAENGDEKTSYELIDEIISLIENGKYLQSLSSQAVSLLIHDSYQNSINSVDNFYNQADTTIESFLSNPLEEVGDECNWFSRAFLVMCIAVAAFLAFTQINLTGPSENFPSFPLACLGSKEVSCGRECHMWARKQLMSTGSDLCGFFSLLQDTLDHFGKLEGISSYWGTQLHEGEALDILSAAHLQAGLIEYTYGRIDHFSEHIKSAEIASGLHDPKTASDTKAGGAANTPLGEIQQAVVLVQCLPLGEIQQAVVLVQCLLISKSSHEAEFERWDMSPYIEAIDAQQYGELLVQCGLIGEALKIFEDLELWNNIIDCYCLIKKKAAAVELIKERLSELPNDPRLWCSLGDVTNIDAHYEKALEVSNNNSARAKRSLARSAYNRGNYEESKTLWESAMALNSLFPDGWFALGAAALKTSSWQMWENFSQVSFQVGNLRQALEATKKVLDTTNNKRMDVQLLERVMVEIEAQALEHSCAPSIGNSSSPDPDAMRSLEAGHLVELLGNVLQQGADLWNNIDRFKKFANASLQLCKVYMEIASSTGSWRELNLAEMHLRSVIRQAVNFSDTDELRDLQACLEEVKKRIEAASVSSNSNHSCLKINLNRLGSSV
ncbi:hypothetical protein MKX01_037972 [Papaver californicum]|nr:hypothetical protein MKX01_037972 [Papaver californicum]